MTRRCVQSPLLVVRCLVVALAAATVGVVGCVDRESFNGIALAPPTGPGTVEFTGGSSFETTVTPGESLNFDVTATGHNLVGNMQIRIERTGGTLTTSEAGFTFAGSQTAYFTAAELATQPQRTLTVTGEAAEPGTIELTATAQDIYNSMPVDEQSWVLHITIFAP